MINVQALSQTLSAMSLPQLQQYASLHKNDPYVVTMALSVANQKKQALTAQQGMAGQQPMPKVVDQDIAQIAPRAAPMPENVGIGQLPALNLQGMGQGMAAGGIVAFDEGGEVPRYQSQGLVQMPTANSPYSIPGFSLPAGSPLLGMPQTGSPDKTPFFQRLIAEAQEEGRKYKLGQAQARITQGVGTKADYELISALAPAAAPTPAAPAAAPIPVSAAQTAPAAGGAAPTADTGATTPPRPQPRPAAAPAAAPTAGLPGLISTPEAMQKVMADALTGVKPEAPEAITTAIEDVRASKQALEDANVERIRKEQAERAPALQNFEKLLNERKERIGKRESDLGPLAMLQAGMAIMSGTSPFAAANIGAGAQVGIKSYTEGAEKLEAARDKMDEAFAKIEEVRRNESRMDAKELREAELNAKKPLIESKQLTLSALTDDWKLKRADAVKGVELLVRNQQIIHEQARQDARTAMTVEAQKAIANMLPGEIRAAMLLGEGETDAAKLKTGLPALLDLKDHMTDTKLAELYQKHIDTRAKELKEPMAPEEFAKYIKGVVGAYRPRVADVSDNQMRTR